MIKFDKADINFIKENFDDADNILQCQDIDVVLFELDIFISKNLDDDYYPNALGNKAQAVYDNIRDNNILNDL